MKDVHLQLACWEQDYLHIEAIRFIVYMEEKKNPTALETDREDRYCRHALAKDPEGRYVGTGRLECDGKLSRIVVLPEYRGHRLGDDILIYLSQVARQLGLKSVYVHAEERHLPFLIRQGYRKQGSLTPAFGIARYKMELPLD
ncbi:GNAT family N-acetyltransferase [Ruficoccus amylovorans]|uniref:GNAT family N-acetyltransferase n=1 Tax=Ruficoccus amylovorans TaxID=1804625 RepID=A0A842HFM1_9BACT|nr:GNAT family N-acetyltransferase [Ruficoccus amylovorans]MBC2595212.1 GNAT family N-acetyltransferase [Ruficoccus amylovorans]